jgi:tetratricopeptide (TPR) repeat protein
MRKKEEEIDSVELKLRDIETLVADKQFKVALHALKDLLGSGVASARAHTLLGEIHYGIDELDKAEKALDHALADKQNYTPAMQMIAKVYSKTERHDKAITMLVQMVDASQNNITTLLGLGSAYNEANQLDKAKETLNRVKSLDPENKAADEELGKIAFKEGNMALAEQLLAETENAEELGRFFNNLAIGLVNKDKYDEGIRTYEAAMNILRGKDNSKLHLLEYNLGVAYRKQGSYQKALNLLAKCYFENPSFRKPYESLIRLIREMEKKKIAYDKSILERIQKMKQAS